MPSPTCQVKQGSGAYQSTSAGVNVTAAGATLTIKLVDVSADSWSITCATTDDTSDAASINAGIVVDSLTKTATLSAPATQGVSWRFKSVINGGIGPDGTPNPSYTTYFCVYTLTAAGLRVVAVDETTESGPFGWSKSLNDVIRAVVGLPLPPADIDASSATNGQVLTATGGVAGWGAGGGGGGTNPASLGFTLYQIDYAGAPWSGTASAGTSGSHSLVSAGSDPAVGSTFGTHPSASFNGTANLLNASVDLATLISAGAYFWMFVISAASYGAPSGGADAYNEPCLVASSDGIIYVSLTTSGIRAGHHDGAFQVTSAYAPVPTAGTKFCVQVWYDGATISARVNTGTAVTTAAGNVSSLLATPHFGSSYNNATFTVEKGALILCAASVPNGSDRDGLVAWAQANLGVP